MRKNPPFLKTFLTILTGLVQGNHNSFFPRFPVFLGLSTEGFEMSLQLLSWAGKNNIGDTSEAPPLKKIF